MPLPDEFACLLVQRDGNKSITTSLERRPSRELPPGDVVVQVRLSSLNYKDALGATGHRGIVRTFPHVPGIDAWGTVLESASPEFKIGQDVIVTGHELGVERWGGWAELIRVPAEWVLPIPEGLTGRECMQLGTAGFTAAQCVAALQLNGVTPDKGEVLVTGATGGVASLAIKLLANLGYGVVALTGKQDRADWLKSLGALRIVGREELAPSEKPLLSARFAAGVDTVGGPVLASLIKQISHRGTVACCGVAGGAELDLTVYPFILRGVTLAGIDSAWCPLKERREIWSRLAQEWRLEGLDDITETVPLSEVMTVVDRMLAGKHTGRTLVDISGR